ncbi:putative lipid II flippase FtsW [Phycicoccus endophyticus]|uniref:Probable peptidoglycan glycosyltransferase FtsW n=1 Tax=Phycicoccus endophyticus TaxID=1690220 RepID=A0A7G9R546_9MICO|nr:putative lipid II flippase FtsW [Phycicoccus endophyticus]NHI20910.1 putative lipid II flippase FtsW [Phycicoccus endophyticus]QNN50721.1 putative lipid II flippase FtsW [Phycicoccus endophyticus]GGL22012.1 cell division protein FtsW [Phycicoccus endophyticus]
MTSATAPARESGRGTTRVRAWAARFDSPVATYYLLLSLTAALVVFGLIMVLSASAITSLEESRSAYTIFTTQAVYAGIGGVALLLASRIPVTGWKRLAVPVLVVAVALQLLVLTPLGFAVNGNRNWLRLGPVTIQPSELVKVGLVLAGGLVLARKRRHLRSLGHVLVPYLVPIAAVSVASVVLGHDLGTVMILGAIVAGVLFAAGVPVRWFVIAGVPFVGMAVAFVVTSPNRLGRFDVWLGRDTDPYGNARQPIHGRYALADGGWLGLGLGQSREKWGLLSEPHNDFIFAIIGEELGLPGTLAILLLFAALAVTCYRLVVRSEDFFVRVVTAGVMMWVIIQAVINIGTVIGLLPVIGVPLPLVSSGGSSLITTMGALGILLSFARNEPGCREVLAARPSSLRRSLAVVSGAVRSRRSGS